MSMFIVQETATAHSQSRRRLPGRCHPGGGAAPLIKSVMVEPFCALVRMAQEWGGDILVFSDGKYEHDVGALPTTGPRDAKDVYKMVYAPRDHTHPWCEAPFTPGHAVWWEKGLIAVAASHVNVPAIIHEMGHVFADPERPNDADEFNWFGWEFAVARKIGIPEEWRASNSTYGINQGEHGDFGDMTRADQDALLDERLDHAVQEGLLTANLQPLAIRRPNALG